MRILQFTFSLTSGGGEKFAVDLANKLSEKDEVFFCVVLSEKYKIHSFFKSQLKKEVTYINLNKKAGINLKTFVEVFKLIKKVKPNVIHFHLNTILYFYLPAILFHKKIKFVHTLHSITSKTIGFDWQKKVNSFFYKKNYIEAVVISKDNQKSFIDFYDHNKVTLIENGIATPTPTDKFTEVTKEINGLKNIPSDKVFIHIGGFLPAKNQTLLISVFNRLIKEGHAVILLVIGKYFDTLEAAGLVQQSEKGIYFLGTRKNVSDYLYHSDAFILSSLWEGLPISLLEAMACGVMPVCTPAGGIVDVIKDSSLGFLSEDFTADTFYQTILNSLQSIEKFDRKNLIQYYKDHYSIDICAKRYLELYK